MKAVLERAGATRMTVSRDEAERLRFWSGRKAAFPGGGPHLARLLLHGRHHPAQAPGRGAARFIAAMEKKYGLRCPNVFHAGDGNLHPLILFDANDAGRAATAPSSSAPRCWNCASRSAAPSPASTASASRRSTRCACSSAPRELDAFLARQARVRPARPAQSGQGDPDAARCAEYGAHARARRQAAASRAAAVLSCESLQESDPAMPRAPQRAAAPARRRQQGLLRQRAARRVARHARLRRHRRLRADRAGGHGALRHAACRTRRRCSSERPVPAVRAAAFRRRARRSAAASPPGSPARGARAPARCATSCSACKLIDGRGEALRFGGQVMKNVAGYDVSRLIAGSLGTLGLITEVSLKVLPLPPARDARCGSRCAAGARARADEPLGRPAAAGLARPRGTAATRGAPVGRRARGARGRGSIGGERIERGDGVLARRARARRSVLRRRRAAVAAFACRRPRRRSARPGAS